MTLELATVATFDFSYEAHMARIQLEGEGVRAVVIERHLAPLRTELRVAKNNEERALEILRLARENASEGFKCIQCDSGDLKMQPRFALLAPWNILALLALPLKWLMPDNRWECQSCGHVQAEEALKERWRNEDPAE